MWAKNWFTNLNIEHDFSPNGLSRLKICWQAQASPSTHHYSLSARTRTSDRSSQFLATADPVTGPEESVLQVFPFDRIRVGH